MARKSILGSTKLYPAGVNEYGEIIDLEPNESDAGEADEARSRVAELLANAEPIDAELAKELQAIPGLRHLSPADKPSSK